MEKTMITRVVPLPSSGSGDARIVRLGASRIVSRRNFLLQGGGALAALSLGFTGCSDNGMGPSDIGDGRNGPDVEEQSIDVIVVGAGLSGLVAAYELVRAGYNVRVLEARNEAGGRARTLREPFDDGLIAETGPARIPPVHDRTLGYIDHFGIKTSPFYPQEDEYLIVREQGDDPLREPPDVFLSGGRDTWVKMPEGTDLLPMAFAEALGDRVRYGSPVTRVVQEDSGVLVTNGTGASTEELKGSHLICTVPPPRDRPDRVRTYPFGGEASGLQSPYLRGRHPCLRSVCGPNLGGPRPERVGMVVSGGVLGVLASHLEPGGASGSSHVLPVRRHGAHGRGDGAQHHRSRVHRSLRRLLPGLERGGRARDLLRVGAPALDWGGLRPLRSAVRGASGTGIARGPHSLRWRARLGGAGVDAGSPPVGPAGCFGDRSEGDGGELRRGLGDLAETGGAPFRGRPRRAGMVGGAGDTVEAGRNSSQVQPWCAWP